MAEQDKNNQAFISATSVNKYDPFSLKDAIDGEIVEVS